MAGYPEKAEKLNTTLLWTLDLLETRGIDKWFVSYGTLLGLIRDGSCIDGDDDVDICIDKDCWDDVYDPIKKLNRLNEQYVKENIIITKRTATYSQVDFYCCDVNEQGDFNDTWEDVIWSRCYNESDKIPTIEFQGRHLNVPHNAIEKLSKRYGSTWNQRIKRGTEAGDGYRKIKVL
ncbi:hypothetical protein BOW86_gp226 [Synechococcus phage S-CAM7]|uniref:Uncharacterized protein n=1 Tax=Synechococcus phage S-CAM7 TaxID=1883368 RepID=A0A1D8KUU4_9CAUD|nr:hypothetical protein BOW86_gp226 [Synechococcus phage S-CAM7]AOV62155.1 hypothetical protein C490910_231 [Synechococcus phage S-CAM7]AOV62419.1 hypothetical protein S420910_231 [Synechococcus phage S-CAM7]QLF86282.1 hypothetical protein CC030809_00234 [Synechococcus phage S-CAM7]